MLQELSEVPFDVFPLEVQKDVIIDGKKYNHIDIKKQYDLIHKQVLHVDIFNQVFCSNTDRCKNCGFNNICPIELKLAHLSSYHKEKQMKTFLENNFTREELLKAIEESNRLHGV
jgi:hypothetical protein